MFSFFQPLCWNIACWWYLIRSIWASNLARSICQNWHSRARGVANLEHVIPMLGGKHYFVWSPCCVGMQVSLFSTPLRWTCKKNMIPDKSQRILQVLLFVLSMSASLFLIALKNVIPTQRGDYIFKVISREVNCCDAELWKDHEKTKQQTCSE